jgi:hypothetical protein
VALSQRVDLESSTGGAFLKGLLDIAHIAGAIYFPPQLFKKCKSFGPMTWVSLFLLLGRILRCFLQVYFYLGRKCIYPDKLCICRLSLFGGELLLGNHVRFWVECHTGLSYNYTPVCYRFSQTIFLLIRTWNLSNNSSIYYSQIDSPVIAFYLSERSRVFDLTKGWIEGSMSMIEKHKVKNLIIPGGGI